ncbi:MAG: SDR family oxidoreductase [Deltaproteobacteria bacterium]
MNLGLRGRVAIVSASSRGLGKAVALGFAEEGARVVMCARGEESLIRAAEEIRDKTGAEVLPIPADVSNNADVNRVVSETLSAFGGVHVLVNNAGGPAPGDFLSLTLDDWRYAIELNLLSAVNFTKAVVPMMKEQRWGRIVNITSISAKQPLAGLILSNASRAAVVGFAKTVSNEFARFNVLVNNVCPGRILTDRIIQLAEQRAVREGVSLEEVLRAMEADVPARRIGSPEEFAGMVLFLASERASYITGATIQVDGGLVSGTF